MKKDKKNNLPTLIYIYILTIISASLGIISIILHILKLLKETLTINDILFPTGFNLLFAMFTIITIITIIKSNKKIK